MSRGRHPPPASPHVRLRVDLSPACSVGPGKIALLEGIATAGSLSGAARTIGMSYRRAWLLLEELNASFREPATTSTVGGAGGGGVELTDFGRELVTRYRAFEQAVGELGARELRTLQAAVAPDGREAPRARRPVRPR